MRRLAGAQGPVVDGSAAAWVLLRKVDVRDRGTDRGGLRVEVPNYARLVAECRSHEKVGPAAAFDQIAHHGRPLPHQVLRRRRFVVHVTGVDIGAVVEKDLRHPDRRRDMQGGLAVAVARVHGRGIRRDDRPEFIRHAVPRRRMRVDPGTPGNEIPGQRALMVEYAEAAGPPVAARVDVGAGRSSRSTISRLPW